MKDRASGFIEVSVARDTLELAPGLTTGMAVGTQVAESQPAEVRTIRVGTEVGLCLDGASASAGEGDDRRWRPGFLGSCIGPLLAGFTLRLVNESGKGLGVFG